MKEAQGSLAIAQEESAKIIKPGAEIGIMADRAQEVLDELGFAEALSKENPARYFGHSQGLMFLSLQ